MQFFSFLLAMKKLMLSQASHFRAFRVLFLRESIRVLQRNTGLLLQAMALSAVCVPRTRRTDIAERQLLDWESLAADRLVQ